MSHRCAPPYWQSVAVLSRYPILETFANGVRLNLDLQQSVCVFGVHLTSTPYQPYRVRDKAYMPEKKRSSMKPGRRESRSWWLCCQRFGR